MQFSSNLDRELSDLSAEIRDGTVSVGRFTSFRIFDPKPRVIHAPCFRERVLHHAIMAYVGPILDRALISDTYACRTGKGLHAAVRRAQSHARRYPWYGKIDARDYFGSVSHGRLKLLLRRRLKSGPLLNLLDRIIGSYETAAGRGLPIGALTSQFFGNYYLSGLDRLLLEHLGVRGMVRYMDDVVWWCDSREEARRVRGEAERYVRESLSLELHRDGPIQRSARGLSFLGFRVSPDRLRLSRRRKRRYTKGRARWETAFRAGTIDALTLQRGYSSVVAITHGAESSAWRREELLRRPQIEA